MKKFAAVRTAYYKDQALTKDVKKNHWINEKQKDGSIKRVKKTTTIKKPYKSAIAELEHVLRTDNINSVNVFDEYTHNNVTTSLKGSSDPLDAYYKLKDKYKTVTGKKCRSDMNTLFEHVIVLSDEYVRHLENTLGTKKAHQEINKCIRAYCKSFAEEFGFSQIGFSTNLDEGHMVTNEVGEKQFKRNYHCHAFFFNYDFKNKKSNLKNLTKKGKNPKTGKTYELNPHFERMQTLLSEKFSKLGFNRGISKVITKAEHLKKDKFIQQKHNDEEAKTKELSTELYEQINRVIGYLSDWLKSLFDNSDNTELYADLTAESLLGIDSNEIREKLENHITENEDRIVRELKKPIEKNKSIIQKINNNK